MKLTWLTDIHLNFLDDEERKIFYQKIKLSPVTIKITYDLLLFTKSFTSCASPRELKTAVQSEVLP